MINFSLYQLPVLSAITKRIQRNIDQQLINYICNILALGGTLHNNQEYELVHTTRKTKRQVYDYVYTANTYSLYNAHNELLDATIPAYIVEFLLSLPELKLFTETTGGNGVARRIEYINQDTGLTVSETKQFLDEFYNTLTNNPDMVRLYYVRKMDIVTALGLDYLVC